MKCVHCDADNQVGDRFCMACGTPLGGACPACGFPIQAAARFCGGCGKRLAPPALANGGPFAAPDQRDSSDSLGYRGSLEAERKYVTVLFADLKGSLELIAHRDPEDAKNLLDPVLRLLIDAVHRYGGTVNQVLGDGIMAIFGAPLAYEDHAVRACYAALRMQEMIQSHSQDFRQAEPVEVRIRVGLNSGEVVVRTIGDEHYMDYSAIGRTTHVAARMEQIAEPGAVLLTDQTLRLAEGFIEAKQRGEMPVKGLSAPVMVHELVAAAANRKDLAVSAARGLTRFVGREQELEQLHRALHDAESGHGQIVALAGEPGVGKSRLIWEFTASDPMGDWRVIEAGAVSHGKAVPYFPVIDLLRTYFEIESGEGSDKIKEKTAAGLQALDPSLAATLPAVRALLGVEVDDPQWHALDPDQRRQRTIEAVKSILLKESQRQPLVFIFEDLQWADAETESVLHSVIEGLSAARLLLLLSHRPEYRHPWADKTSFTSLLIQPLPTQGAERILSSLLGPDPELDPLKQMLMARTEGNPFFLEESVRSLVDSEKLIGQPGAYRPAQAVQDFHVPATVQAVLAFRVDRLPREDKHLLQAAAVIGKNLAFPILRAVARMPEDTLRAHLKRLQDGEFLVEAPAKRQLQYSFRHALTHEVVYGSLLQEQRQALHASIVAAIEQLHADQLDDHTEALAHHAFRGNMWPEAVQYLRHAGTRALSRSANKEAQAYFGNALDALAHLPADRATTVQGIDLRLDLRTALIPLGDHAKILEHLRDAEALAESIDDQRRLARVNSNLTQVSWLVGDWDRALDSGQRNLARVQQLGEFDIEIATKSYLGLAYYSRGDYRAAIPLLQSNAAMLVGDLAHKRFGLSGLPSVLSRSWLAWTLAECGEFEKGLEHAVRALEIAESAKRPFDQIQACLGLSGLLLRKGDLDKAVSVLRQSLELCQDSNIALLLPRAAAALGYAYALCGRGNEGVPLLERSLEQIETFGLFAIHSMVLVWTGEALLLAGQTQAARRRADEALAWCRQRKERGVQAWGLRLNAEIYAHDEVADLAQAKSFYGDAIALADELGMSPLAALCHQGLAGVLGRDGDPKGAQEHQTLAETMMRDMGMTPRAAR